MRSVFRCKVIACLMLLLGLCFGMAFSVYAEPVAVNETNFPDAQFRNWVTTNYGNELNDKKINNTTVINIGQKAIRSLKGIEFFTSLKNLTVNNNLFESVDLSGNPALESVNLSSNEKLKSISFPQNAGSLQGLDVSRCAIESIDVSSLTALDRFQCDNNQLTKLDLSKNTALTWLDCSSNQLTELDLTKNTALTQLSCNYNRLTKLYLTGNTDLTTLSCYVNQLTELDLTKNTALTYLDCNNNKLSELILTENTALTRLECYSNPLIKLDLTKNTKLTNVQCNGCDIREMNITGLSLLESIYFGDNYLLSLDTSTNIVLRSDYDDAFTTMNIREVPVVEADGKYLVDFSGDKGWTGNPSDYSFIDNPFGGFSDNAPTITNKGLVFNYDPLSDGSKEKSFTLKYSLSNGYYLDDKYFTIPVTIKSAAYFDDTTVSVTEDNFPDENLRKYLIDNYSKDTVNGDPVIRVGDVDSISISYQENLSLKGIELLTSLVSLECCYNQMTELDISKNTALESLICWGNQLTKLDLTKNTALTSLDCSRNQLTGLDLSKNTALTNLSCEDNRLMKLDISGCTELSSLSVGDNLLMSLDTSNNTKLSGGWDSRKILGSMNTRKVKVTEDNGKFFVDLSAEKGWTEKVSDYSIDEYPYDFKTEITDKGLMFDDDPFSDGAMDISISIKYDLSNGYGMDGFSLLIPFTLKDEAYFSYGTIAVTEENFPDEYFRAFLKNNYCWDSNDENPVIEIGAFL